MSFTDKASLYDILEIKPDASPQEVREAYLRTKSAYGKDSVALYTLINAEEREEMLSRIQHAYETLSNEDRRKEYDRSHGILELDGHAHPPEPISKPPLGRKIISIDRVPPMENSSDSENLLVAPTTDFQDRRKPQIEPPAKPHPTPPPASRHQPQETATPPPPAPTPIQRSQSELALSQEIARETEWRGSFLRRVREARRLSIEELSSSTKIGKNYLLAIEEDNFAKLPAPVFLRGFVTQMAKFLRLPHDQVAAAYMTRYQQATADKTNK